VSVVGVTETVPATPVPFRTTDCGAIGGVGVTVSNPVRAPVPEGVNATAIVQLEPGATEKQEINDGNEKSSPFAPVKVSFGMVRTLSPVLETVTNIDALCVFTICDGKVTGEGARPMTGPVAVPFRFNVIGPPADSVYTN